ncbi:unnamed protein product (macronuclear) [Paramecium tetraurelia]|uniref:Uncharacterized protein n=1 Tax=Paramecium tetraurelia TaxID=5888 RepID=A0DWC5_PARTE|nr:uncharacterized protein GSPATT00020984001 [Paramecium tetraurelia]CAK87342.1 unnamed protein product [Paramecium tetraurelia]|eukprot:XP_001454739.1 hypothetical protein (macronuclear) [Paramecium tetraurelia strain d4-2]
MLKAFKKQQEIKIREKAAAFMVQQKQKQEIQNQGSSRTTDRTKSIENSLVGEASDKPEKSNYVIKEQQKFQPQIDMRKGFAGRYDKKGEWEHYLPPLPSVQERENQQLKQLVKFTIKFVDKVPKLKLRQRLKSCFLAIKALVRWAKLVKSLIQKKRLNSFFYSNCFKEVIYNDQIKAIKFKQWTQMVFSKVFNQIKKERLEQYQNLNIIDGPYQQLSPKEHDICVLKLRYFIQLMLEGFLVMTNKPNLLKELVGEMYISQFQDQRNCFYLFTSLRTMYLQNKRDELPSMQRAMIFVEFLIMRIIVQNIQVLINQDKILNTENNTISYLLKLLISFLHYLYLNIFSKLEIVKIRTKKQLIQKQLIINQNVQLIDVPSSKDSQDLIIGIYNYESLKPILESQRWKLQMKSIFKKVIQNLEQHEL